jgi:peptidoglycan/xylan/chitin deacetylase (PgdA/CDA1 family)
MYHWFRRAGAPSISRSPQLETTPEEFVRQMAFLGRAGYRTVPLARVLTGPGGAVGFRRSVVLTFDDGTLDSWEQARPVLDRHGFTATLFIVSGHVGGRSTWDRDVGEPSRPLMSWNQIRELQEAGFEIGSHTHTHRPLGRLSDAEARSELELSFRTLEQQLGTVPRFLAYPRGSFTERHKRLARETGYSGACAVLLRWGDLMRSDRYALMRMTVKGGESMFRFRIRLAASRLVRHVDGVAGTGNEGSA